MIRIVIDTNVLIFGLLFGGTPGKLVLLWKNSKIRPLTSTAIFQEYLRVLAYPRFHVSKAEIDYIISVEILPWFEIIDVSPGKPMVLEDPADDKFIWCALSGEAEAIISRDDHLLSLPDPPVPILTPSRFLNQMQ